MPINDFKCPACNNKFEKIYKHHEIIKCEKCDVEMLIVYSKPPVVNYIGQGFHENDRWDDPSYKG